MKDGLQKENLIISITRWILQENGLSNNIAAHSKSENRCILQISTSGYRKAQPRNWMAYILEGTFCLYDTWLTDEPNNCGIEDETSYLIKNPVIDFIHSPSFFPFKSTLFSSHIVCRIYAYMMQIMLYTQSYWNKLHFKWSQCIKKPFRKEIRGWIQRDNGGI